MSSARCRCLGPGRAIQALVLVLAFGTSEAAPKTDVIELTNGDHLTGEIKNLEQGLLQVSTNTMSTVYIKWEQIRSLRTQQYLQVELQSGRRHFGTAPEQEPEQLAIHLDDAGGVEIVPLVQVVRIDPIERGELLQRLKGNFSLGYNYTKASEVETMTFSGELRSRTDLREWLLDGSANVTTQSGPDSTRFDVSGSYSRFLARRKYWMGRLRLESNSELALDLRTSLGGGLGYYLRQDAHHEWAILGGLALNEEKYSGEPARTSTDAIIATSYYYYRFDPLNADLDFQLALIPSLTVSGRLRSDTNLALRWEIIDDLYFELSVYGNYDSQPGEEANSKYDYGTTTSLGYSF